MPSLNTAAQSFTTIETLASRVTYKKLGKVSFSVDGFITPVMVLAVPGQRHPSKANLSVSIPRELHQSLKRLAAQRETTVTELVEYVLWRETKDIELTPEDYEEIRKQTEAYLKGIDRRRKSDPRRPGA
jgi:hypothetical protein